MPIPLPSELVACVAEQASNDTLLAMRQTSRSTAESVNEVFLQRFFAVRRHVDTHRGLETLVTITQNPNLRKAIRAIEIHTMDPDRRYAQLPEKTIPERQFDGNKLFIMTGGQYWGRFIFSGQPYFDAGHPYIGLLAEALRNLGEAGIGPEVKARALGRSSLQQGVYGLGEFQGEEEEVLGMPVDGVALPLLAVAEAETPVRSLDLGYGLQAPGDRDNGVYGVLTPETLSRLAEGVTTLAVDLDRAGHLVEESQQHQKFADFLKVFSNLRELKVLWSEDMGGMDAEEGDAFASWLPAAGLEKLTFRQGTFPPEVLRRILGSQRKTLRHLRLEYAFEGAGEGGWADSFAWMASELRLESVRFENLLRLCCSGDKMVIMKAEFMYEGEKRVREGLAEMAKLGCPCGWSE